MLLLLLCAPLLGLIGVIAAEAVPDGRIANHLLDAERAGILATEVGRATSPLDTTVQTPAECGALSIGLGAHPGDDHVTTAIVSPAYRSCPSLHRGLEEFEATGQLRPGVLHLRYWHGYAVMTRPVLALFGLAGTRWIAFGLLALTMVGMAASVARAFGVAAGALLVAPTLLTTDSIIGGLSAVVAISTAGVFAGGWMSFLLVSRRPTWTTAALAAALSGSLSAYLDLLINVPGAYSLTVASVALGLVATGGVAALHRQWRVVAAAALGWAVGHVWMLGSKWVIAAIVVGVDRVVESVNSRLDAWARTGEGSALYRSPPSRIHGLTDNLGMWWSQPLTPWVVGVILAVLVVAGARRQPSVRTLTSPAVGVLLAVVPLLVWYLALPHHSQFHSWLVYRAIPVAFGGVAVLCYVCWTADRPPPAPALAEEATVGQATAG